jgi:hypothetical protein
VLTQAQAAALEALSDERLSPLPEGAVPPALAAELAGVDPEQADLALEAYTAGRAIEWASRTITQGEILGAFVLHCQDVLDDVDVVESTPTVLLARWRRETSRIELRAGVVAVERLASDTPTLVLADVEGRIDELVKTFVADPELRSRLAVYDLARLEKLGAVRSSVFVYFEWFLRDAYGVKLLPSASFTQGLIDQGVISLGMG